MSKASDMIAVSKTAVLTGKSSTEAVKRRITTPTKPKSSYSSRGSRSSRTVASTSTPAPPTSLTKQDVRTDIAKTQVGVVRTPFVPAGEKVKAVMQLQRTKKQVSDFPKGTTFTPTKQGYDVNIPDTVRLEWAQHYRKESQAIPSGASEISRFGSGLVQSMFAITKPVAGLLGFGKKFDKMATVGMSAGMNPFDAKGITKSYVKGTYAGRYGIHYPSTLDVAFDPIGWSPKGSSEFVRGDPWYFAGGVGGEVAQSIGFTAALRPVGHGAKLAGKTVIRKTPDIFSKLSKTFPKVFNITTSESGKLIGSKTAQFTHKLSHTPFSKHLYGWGAKGWKPGRKLIEHKLPKIVSKGGMEYKTTLFKSDKSTSLWNRRIWMEADDVLRYQQKIATSGKMDIRFPIGRTRAGVGKATGITDVTIWKQKGWLSKKLHRTYGYSQVETKIGKKFPVSYMMEYSDDLSKYTGFTRQMQPFAEKVGTGGDEWYKFVTGYYGTPQQAYLRPGSVISKKWHLVALGKKKLRTSFLQDISGSASIMSKPTLKTTYRGSLSMFGKKSTDGLRMVAHMPRKIAFPLTASSLAYTQIKGMSSFMAHRQKKNVLMAQQKITLPTLESRRASVSLHQPISVSARDTISMKIPVFDTVQKSAVKTKLDLDTIQRSVFEPKLTMKLPLPVFPIPKVISATALPLPKSLYGRGDMGWGEYGAGKRYRYREFKVADLKKLLGG